MLFFIMLQQTSSIILHCRLLPATVSLIKTPPSDNLRRAEATPDKLVLILLVVQAMAQPDIPHNIEVRSGASSDVPAILSVNFRSDAKARGVHTTSRAVPTRRPKEAQRASAIP